MSTKIAILMGRCLILWCRKAVAKSHKVRKWKPKENDKRNTKKLKKKKHKTRLRAEKQEKLYRGKKIYVFCAVAAEIKWAPKILWWLFCVYEHTVGLSLSIPSSRNWPISLWSGRSSWTRIGAAEGKLPKPLPNPAGLGIRDWLGFSTRSEFWMFPCTNRTRFFLQSMR